MLAELIVMVVAGIIFGSIFGIAAALIIDLLKKINRNSPGG